MGSGVCILIQRPCCCGHTGPWSDLDHLGARRTRALDGCVCGGVGGVSGQGQAGLDYFLASGLSIRAALQMDWRPDGAERGQEAGRGHPGQSLGAQQAKKEDLLIILRPQGSRLDQPGFLAQGTANGKDSVKLRRAPGQKAARSTPGEPKKPRALEQEGALQTEQPCQPLPRVGPLSCWQSAQGRREGTAQDKNRAQ